jgi:uncharacterized cofD-like protein
MSKKRKKIGFKRRRRIVCFGGGNLVPKVILEPLKRYPVEITAVTSMTEGGGSTGQLRNDFNVLPSGDISRHLVALSGAPRWKRDLFYSRFGREKFSGGHIGHRFGTVFISLVEHFLGSFEKALRFAHEFLEVKEHRALPATTNKVQLMAELENGEIIEGEDEIDIPKKHKSGLRIRKVFLEPKARIFPPVRSAIIGADLIVLGPGDFYSSTIPCLLPYGIKAAFRESKAKKVFICNTITKLGETNGFSVLDFVGEIENYIGVSLDFVVYHKNGISRKDIEKYKRINRLALKPVRVDKGLSGRKFIGENLLLKTGALDFNSDKLAKIIFNLCKR